MDQVITAFTLPRNQARGDNRWSRRARLGLGTIVDIAIDAGSAQIPGVWENVFHAIARAEIELSYFKPEGALGRLNQAKPNVPVPVTALLWQVLRVARDLFERSGGVFNPVAPATEKDGADLSTLDFRDPPTVVKRRPLEINLGGIGKGAVIDEAVRALEAAGVIAGTVNIGGDLRVFGPVAQPVYLRHPQRICAGAGVVTVWNEAVATSANYFRSQGSGCDGDQGIFDFDAGDYWSGQESVSVVAPEAIYADALTKVVALLGERAKPLLDSYGARAIVVRADTPSSVS